MTYETVIDEAVTQIPELAAMDRDHFLEEEPPLTYTVFGALLIPVLENALNMGDLKVVLRICAFLEEASEHSQNDGMLKDLIHIEIGEWLSSTSYEEQISPWLGQETKLICGYVPGLATQRLELSEQRKRRRIGFRVSAWWRNLIGSNSRNAD